jgi:hypothetical protein
MNIEWKCLKSDKEVLEKEVNKLSVALKSSKQEVKETVKKCDVERKQFEKEINHLYEYKLKHETEARELKKKEKKIMKRAQKETKKVAEFELKKMRAERETKKKEINDTQENLEHDSVDLQTETLTICLHAPQCSFRAPYPPPHGPQTYKQSELENVIIKTEATESFKESVMEFMRNEPGDTLDTTIAKLEALKAMLEPDHNDDEAKESEFEKLIQMVKNTKEALEKLNDDDVDELDYEDYDDIPRHYWGGNDGNEIIFFEDDE